MSATFYRRLMNHRSFGAIYISLRSIWQTGLKFKINSIATKISSLEFHWNSDNIRITFEGRTNERHSSVVFLISMKSIICTAAQLENHASLPRAPSLDTKEKILFTSNPWISLSQKKRTEKNHKLTSISRLCTHPQETNNQLFRPIN